MMNFICGYIHGSQLRIAKSRGLYRGERYILTLKTWTTITSIRESESMIIDRLIQAIALSYRSYNNTKPQFVL